LEKKYGYEERDYAGKGKYLDGCIKRVIKELGDNGWHLTSERDANPEQLKSMRRYEQLLNNKPEYQDFWHFLLDHHEIYNGGFFTMNKDILMEEADDWQKEILQHYFGEFDPSNKGEIEFYVSW
jgi:hypothetical protein